MSRIVVTGADGFIGKPLAEMLGIAGHHVVPVTRNQFVFGDKLMSDSMLESIVRDSQAVIHLAGRAHVVREYHANPLAEFRRTNVDGTVAMARTAAKLGVDRFVFLSSIGVLGNSSGAAPFTENDTPAPNGPYAISKWEAEQALQSLVTKSGLKLVVVRPPLVYGPNVKGNFLKLLALVKSGLPLPFAGINNSRSYIGVHNLCEFLLACVDNPAAVGLTFNVADGEDISTPDLLTIIARSMGKKPRMFRCQTAVLRALTSVVGKRDELERLISSLRVDATFARSKLGWLPSRNIAAGIGEMVQSFASAPPLDSRAT